MSDTTHRAPAAQPDTAFTEAPPRPEHQWLLRLVGEWTYEVDEPGQPGQPPTRLSGSETVRALGDLWILAEGRGRMPDGTPATTLMTLGYDPERGRFVGSWIGSMMTHLWTYDGELDPSQTRLTLSSQGPSMAGEGRTTRYQDVIELTGDDRRTLTASVEGPDGTWKPFMSMAYRRTR